MIYTDADIIAEGRFYGLHRDSGDMISGFPDPLGARWLRFCAACARAELVETTDADTLRHLTAVAHQCDAEAAAREASILRGLTVLAISEPRAA